MIIVLISGQGSRQEGRLKASCVSQQYVEKQDKKTRRGEGGFLGIDDD